MKILLIATGVILLLFIAAQVAIKISTNRTETHAYQVLDNYGDFEIRRYAPANYSYTIMRSNSYKAVSNRGFRTLAGYIFGNNARNQKIAMTTPVSMSMDDSVTMKFKIPEGLKMEELPKPSDPNVHFVAEPEKIVAAICFGGWSSDERIAEYTAKLRAKLDEQGLVHGESFSYLGYNPPFELFGRRNEIVVDVTLPY
ncbi:MAG: heme-binding protein [Flavobacteriales bacterium]|nr:heme-binding protein [Flavobacteriales bacterium]